MMRPTLLFAALAAGFLVPPAHAADSKEVSCDYQAQVVAAVQQARKDKVQERDVPDHIAASSPTWPENYNAAIPLIAPWVYQQKMKTIRKDDLSAAWKELCLQQ